MENQNNTDNFIKINEFLNTNGKNRTIFTNINTINFNNSVKSLISIKEEIKNTNEELNNEFFYDNNNCLNYNHNNVFMIDSDTICFSTTNNNLKNYKKSK